MQDLIKKTKSTYKLLEPTKPGFITIYDDIYNTANELLIKIINYYNINK